jgi:COMPASS component SPP1
MSFLSSLLNPGAQQQQQQPDQDKEQEAQLQQTDDLPSDQRKQSLPSVAHIQSPEQHHVSLPQYTPPSNRSSPPQAQDAVQALNTFSASTAPPPSEWNGHTAAGSSSVLEQHHVPSCSSEQRRASLVLSTGDAAFTLPSLQNVTSSIDGERRRNSAVSTHDLSPTSARAAQAGSTAQGDGGDQARTHAEPATSQALVPSLVEPSDAMQQDAGDLSPAHIKQESLTVPASPIDARRPSLLPNDMEPSKAISTLKRENSARHQSPLRESSVPMPSTEDVVAESNVPRKRPLPKKKGTATTMKKAPPAKKRKLESTRSDTPSSRVSKTAFKTGSSKGTPVNSSPAPSDRSGSVDPYDDDEEEEEGTPVSDDLYCICRRPDTGTFMIGCDGPCEDWCHGKCVGIAESDKNLIDKFMCPACTEKGIGRTTWKRMCRRSGCRQPARLGKNKQGSDGSKYCSDECGVRFFRQMTERASENEYAAKSRTTRRKSGHVPSDSNDLGARGGVLAPNEVRALLDSTRSLEDFKKLGDGVLSPPATPDGKRGSNAGNAQGDFTEMEMRLLTDITTKKNDSRVRHQLLKDRQLFINMTKQAASRACSENQLKPKDYCGFDPRLEWSEEQFAIWRNNPVGKQAFEMETLAVEHTGDDHMVDADDEYDGVLAPVKVCDKKKCPRHLEWLKLATDDVRFEMSDNGDRMRALDREEREIRERAALRLRAGGEFHGEGSVEVHGDAIVTARDTDENVEKTQDPAVAAPLPPAPESVVPALPPSEAMELS